MRLSVTKKQHQQLLMEIAYQLRSNDPKDALEHVLNCWISPCHPQPQVPTAAGEAVTADSPDGDLDIDALASWD